MGEGKMGGGEGERDREGEREMGEGERGRGGERKDTKGEMERQGRDRKEKGGCLHYAVGATVNPMATCTLYLG